MHKMLVLTSLFALVVGVCGLPAWAQEESGQQVFAQLDSDKDGKLSLTEFSAHPGLTNDMFGAWDSNGDKYVSKTEFIANYGKSKK